MERNKRRLLAALALLALLLSACGGEKNASEGAPEAVLLSALPADQLSAEQGQEGIIFLGAVNGYVAIEGIPLFRENGNQFYRMKLEDAISYNDAVQEKNWYPAGGRLRFRTNSQRLSLRIQYGEINTVNSNTSLLAAAALEVYLGTGTAATCVSVVCPDQKVIDYTAKVALPATELGEMQDITIYLPHFSAVKKIEIGLDSGAMISRPLPHAVQKPIVFYGSSITQGAGASRPGTTYVQLVTKSLDAELIDLGFSGGAHGEIVMADFVAKLEMAALVIDYDYNAMSLEHLQNTYYPFYEIIRRAHPDLPVILLSRVNDAQGADDPIEARRAVIKETYDRARAAGDRNIYFIDGSTVMGESHRDLYFVDGIHPNDIGHLKIAEALLPVLKKALKL